MLIKKLLLPLFFLLSLSFYSFGQCPDAITGIADVVDNGDGTCTFTVDVDITSNGNSSAEIWLEVDDNGTITEYDNDGNCEATNLSGTQSFSYGPFTMPCSATLTAKFLGHSSPSCGGSTCAGEVDLITILPVDLISFNAKHSNNEVNIFWSTASEVHNKNYEVQHSLDGIDFKAIGMVNGMGSSDIQNDYQFSHRTPSKGANYYRLKQVDLDGLFEIFNTVVVNIKSSDEIFNVFPTMASEVLVVEASASTTKDRMIQIFNSSGALVSTQILAIGEQKIEFNVADLPAGLYYTRIGKSNTSDTLKRFVKLNN